MPDLTRAKVEKCIARQRGVPFREDMLEKIARDWLILEARVRELEAANTRLTKLTQMQDAFITEKSGLAAERLAEVNRLAVELQALKDGLEEETQG